MGKIYASIGSIIIKKRKLNNHDKQNSNTRSMALFVA
jgi:hypothetical protein